MKHHVESTYGKRETEMMICMKEQGYFFTLGGKRIGFHLHDILDMWDILREEVKD